ncbi:MAG: DUF1203 domain-containing protein [Steroidobacteraceae bacterium]
MSFRILGLSAEPFRPLFGLPDDELLIRGARRYIVDAHPGFPDRVELRDLEPGETALLLNYLHQPADTPYRAGHAIFVREGAESTGVFVDEVPEVLQRRVLSLRAFDGAHMMADAALVDGREAAGAIGRLLDNPEIAYIQAHYALRGCYAARVERG